MIDASYAGDFKNFEHVNSQECDITAIVFTSGSTGRPKGVRYLIQNFNSQILSLQNNFWFKSKRCRLGNTTHLFLVQSCSWSNLCNS